MSTIAAEITRLKHLASCGDERALREIFEAGGEVVDAVTSLWSGDAAVHNPFARNREARLAAQQRMIRMISQDVGYVPAVAEVSWSMTTWDHKAGTKKQAGRTKRLSVPGELVPLGGGIGGRVSKSKDLLRDLCPPHFAGRGRRGMVRWILEHTFLCRVREARDGLRDEPTLARLPPLTVQAASAWATAARDLVWQKQMEAIRTEGTDWNFIARGGKKKLSRKKEEKGETTKRMVKKLNKDGEPGRAKTREEYRDGLIKSQRATDADLRDGLYQEFLRAFTSIARNPRRMGRG